MVHLLHCLKEWATELPQDAPQLMKESAAMIDNILHGSELEEVLEQTSDEEKRLSNFVIDKFDYLFRCTRLYTVKKLTVQQTYSPNPLYRTNNYLLSDLSGLEDQIVCLLQ